MDTRFSSAIHALILISQSATPVNSEQIAVSVGTNPSYIRKLTARLNKAGIIEGRRGISGFRLLRQPGDITLLDVYRAVMDADSVHLFDLHHNPNDMCIVGHNIRPVLGGMFQQMDDDVNHRLRGMTLTDCIRDMRAYMARTGQADPRQGAANHSSRTGAAAARE